MLVSLSRKVLTAKDTYSAIIPSNRNLKIFCFLCNVLPNIVTLMMLCILVQVIAWVAMKFGMNMYQKCYIENGWNFTRQSQVNFHFQEWHLFQISVLSPCNSQLIPYSMPINDLTFSSAAIYYSQWLMLPTKFVIMY